MALTRAGLARTVPGLVVAFAAAVLAWAVHLLLPPVPMLTAAVALGMVVAQFPRAWTRTDTTLSEGLRIAARRLLRIGIVLLGLKLSLVDIAGLGWAAIAAIVLIVVIVFLATWAFGRVMRLPGDQPLLVAAGFSICGVSAIGAMSAVTKGRNADAAAPIALVTLCGTLAIFVLPVLRFPLGLSEEQFGIWVGLSVHDVGQVVATAQVAGPAALAVAVVVKLTRVLMLAPMVAAAGLVQRRRSPSSVTLPPVVPLFVAAFVAAIVVRTLLTLPAVVLDTADLAQNVLLAMALFALGTSIRFATLFRTGWRALVVGLASWALIAGLSLVAVWALTWGPSA